jgi:hypothetical protein
MLGSLHLVFFPFFLASTQTRLAQAPHICQLQANSKAQVLPFMEGEADLLNATPATVVP